MKMKNYGSNNYRSTAHCIKFFSQENYVTFKKTTTRFDSGRIYFIENRAGI